MPSYPSLLGLSELASLTGVPTQTLSNWCREGVAPDPLMPEPIAQLKCGKIWDQAAILDWWLAKKSKGTYHPKFHLRKVPPCW